jgi:hypothetical protein
VDAATPRTQTRWKLYALSCPISHNRCQPSLQQTLAGRVVRCVTIDMQRIAHRGYDLSAYQVKDLELLDESASDEDDRPGRG